MDPCLYLRDDMILIVYVDDAILCAQSEEALDRFMSELTRDGLEHSEDGDMASYLGVTIDKRSDGSIMLRQEYLTTQLIDMLGLSDSSPKDTPVTKPLGKHPESPPASETFNYRSAIGMLLYLGNNTRPDCSFGISQCARYSNSPREIHEQAVKRIGRYLMGTRKGGIIFKPSPYPSLDDYVDADFGGLWQYEDLQDEDCVRSRTGFVITLGTCPVYWSSKLQTEIATSTMEAEYIALSTSMKILIPLRAVHNEIVDCFKLPANEVSTLSNVWEDNRACLILANANDPPRLTPRSKSIAVKYHWFRSKLRKGEIEVKPIPTTEQKANILTKALTRDQFNNERLLLMGWDPRSDRGRVSES
jgi:hypothetical protein